MRMSPGWRKFSLILHLISSLGWMGAVAAYLVLDLTVATSQNAPVVAAAWTGMALIVSTVIVPLALAALLTGIIQSLGTQWGLFRHWWVLISLLLTVFATVILLIEAESIRATASLVADPTAPGHAGGGTLLHSIGGLVVLSVITVLNVYKPKGLTPYGWRKQQEERGRT